MAEVASQPGALPLLQYALTELFDTNVSGLLLLDRYRELGGLSGALARRADELHQSATAPERAAIRGLFGRLISLGEGTEDTRRRLRLSELAADQPTDNMIDTYGAARLLTFDRDPATREPTVEVAHEALIREWPRLIGWLDDDRQGLRILRHLTNSADAWADRGRDDGELYPGVRLDAAEAWTTAARPALNPQESDFLRASLDRRDAEALAERNRIRRLRRLLVTTGIVAVVALIAGAIAFRQQQRADDQATLATTNEALATESAALAVQRAEEAESARAQADLERVRAEEVAFDAETARLAATAQLLAPTKPREAMLLAVAAHQREQSPATLTGLHAVLSQAGPLLGHIGWGTDYIDVAWPSAGRVVGIRADGLDLYERDSGRLLDSVDLEVRAGFAVPGHVRAAGGFGLLAVASSGRTVHVFTVTDRLDERFEKAMPALVMAVDVSPDGESIVATSTDGSVAAWTTEGTELFAPLTLSILTANQAEQQAAYTDAPIFPGVAADAVAILALAHEDHIDVQVGASTFRLGYDGESLSEPVYTFVDLADFGATGLLPARVWHVLHPTPEETFVSSATSFGLIATNGDAGTRGRLAFGEGTGPRSDTITHAYIGEDGRPVALLDDGALVWFDLETGARVESIDLGVGAARSAAVGSDPGTLAIATSRGIALVSLNGAGPLTRAVPRTSSQTQLSVSHNGRFVTVGPSAVSAPLTVYEYDADAETYRALDDFQVSVAAFAGMAVDHWETAEGLFVWGYQGDGTSAGSGGPGTSLFFDLDTPDAPSLYLAMDALDGLNVGDGDPSERWFVVDSNVTGFINVHDRLTGEIVQQLPPPAGVYLEGGITGLRFHPSGESLLASAATGLSQLWDTGTWTPIDESLLAQYDIVVGYWNQDGSLLATAAVDGQITIRDGETFEPIQQMVGAFGTFNNFNASPLLFSRDSALLLTDHDNVGRLWDVATGQQIGIDMVTAEATNSGANHGDSLQLITGSDSAALIWNLDADSWADIACAAAGSNLTETEWEQWGPRDEDHRAICEEFPP